MSTTNVFACLVHEAPDCVVDLVANLRCLDPESIVLLYDGSGGRLLRELEWIDQQVHVVPGARPMAWGRLHAFALDCMRFSLDRFGFDALTIVDSDQLLLRPGYSERLRQMLADYPTAGCFGTSSGPLARNTNVIPAQHAWQERDRWLSYLERRFPGRVDLYPHWTFWPSTVFTVEACRRLTKAWDDPELRDLADGARILATEEVLLPTLTALLGLDTVRTPLRQDVVGFRRPYTVAEVARVADHPDAFWVHPVPRSYDDPRRRWIRDRFHRYAGPAGGTPQAGPSAQVPAGLVSGLMVVGGRPHEAQFALRQWGLQDYAQRELVVVDDGDQPLERSVHDRPDVRYVRPLLRCGRVAMLNLAAGRARGDFLVHWDESGWCGPRTISDALRALAEADADLVGRRSFVAHDPSTGAAWGYEYPRSRRLWLADFTLVYRRALWEAQPFSEATHESHIGFYWPLQARKAVAMEGRQPHVRVLGETVPSGPWWRNLPGDYLPEALGSDWPSYVATREPA